MFTETERIFTKPIEVEGIAEVEALASCIESSIIALFILFIEFLILIITVGIVSYLGNTFGLLIAKTLFHSLPTKFQVPTKSIREFVILLGVITGVAAGVTIFTHIIFDLLYILFYKRLPFLFFEMGLYRIDLETFFEFSVYGFDIYIPTLFVLIMVFISMAITVILYAWKYSDAKVSNYICE